MTLTELQKLVDSATAGPWLLAKEPNNICCVDVGLGKDNQGSFRSVGFYQNEWENAQFIAAARTYMPLLIKVAEAARLMLNSGNFVHEDFGVTALEKALEEIER